jgi:hypothetical protein
MVQLKLGSELPKTELSIHKKTTYCNCILYFLKSTLLYLQKVLVWRIHARDTELYQHVLESVGLTSCSLEMHSRWQFKPVNAAEKKLAVISKSGLEDASCLQAGSLHRFCTHAKANWTEEKVHEGLLSSTSTLINPERKFSKYRNSRHQKHRNSKQLGQSHNHGAANQPSLSVSCGPGRQLFDRSFKKHESSQPTVGLVT